MTYRVYNGLKSKDNKVKIYFLAKFISDSITCEISEIISYGMMLNNADFKNGIIYYPSTKSTSGISAYRPDIDRIFLKHSESVDCIEDIDLGSKFGSEFANLSKSTLRETTRALFNKFVYNSQATARHTNNTTYELYHKTDLGDLEQTFVNPSGSLLLNINPYSNNLNVSNYYSESIEPTIPTTDKPAYCMVAIDVIY